MLAYLYFAVGPTKDHGIAQWNAVERAIEVVRDTFFGLVTAGRLDRGWA